MTTPTQQQIIDDALMAGAAYISTKNVINQIPTPTGWQPILNSYVRDQNSGFEAVSFQQGNSIVISFAGTGTAVDWLANIGGAFGVTTTQLEQAAEYYLQIKNDPVNAGKTISFTGHSLGGGLASLMAVFFNKQAVTFDQAPFANSASVSVATTLENYLSGLGYTVSDLQGLTNFINAAGSGGIPNASNVTDINVQGEMLSSLPFSRIGTQTNIADSAGSASMVNLHSQTLLTAFLLSDQASALQNSAQTLDAVTFKLTDLLGMIFNSQLFYNEPNNINPNAPKNFLELLVQHQEGFTGASLSGSTVTTPAITPDKMVTRFTADLWQIARAGSP